MNFLIDHNLKGHALVFLGAIATSPSPYQKRSPSPISFLQKAIALPNLIPTKRDRPLIFPDLTSLLNEELD